MVTPPKLAQYRLPPTDELVGSSVEIQLDGGEELTMSFRAPDEVEWRWGGGDGGVGRPDVVLLREGLFFVAVDVMDPPTSGLTVVFAHDGPALVVIQRRLPAPGRDGSSVANTYLAGRIGGTEAPAPRPTRDLLGRWHRIRYSDANLYEHIYISSDRFCSHNLVAENTLGRAACHAIDYWRFAPQIYVVAWRERDSGAAMITVEDLDLLRTTGAALAPAGPERSISVPIGGVIEVLRVARDIKELEARAGVSGWEPGDQI